MLSAGKVAVTDQQVKEILQEVARLQTLGNLIAWVREKEDKQIQLNPESIKVGAFSCRCVTYFIFSRNINRAVGKS